MSKSTFGCQANSKVRVHEFLRILLCNTNKMLHGSAMSTIRNTSTGGLIVGALLSFAVGIFGFVQSETDATLATNQKSTTTSVTRYYVSRTDSSGDESGSFQCNYHFTVDSKDYRGSTCPVQNLKQFPMRNLKQSMESQITRGLSGPDQFQATVYFDPSDPTTNSLSPYGAVSENDSRIGMGGIVLGVILLIFALLAVLLSNNSTTAAAAQAAAAQGPTTMPAEYIPSEQKFLEDLDRELRSKEPPDHMASS